MVLALIRLHGILTVIQFGPFSKSTIHCKQMRSQHIALWVCRWFVEVSLMACGLRLMCLCRGSQRVSSVLVRPAREDVPPTHTEQQPRRAETSSCFLTSRKNCPLRSQVRRERMSSQPMGFTPSPKPRPHLQVGISDVEGDERMLFSSS